MTGVSPNPASFGYFLVEKSLLALPNLLGRSQESAYPLTMSMGMVWLYSCLFGAWQPLEPWIWQSHTSYLSPKNSWLHPPVPVGSICHVSSSSAEGFLCGAVPFWWLCPTPSQVIHHHGVCRGLYLLHRLPRLLHHAHHRNLHDRLDCLH